MANRNKGAAPKGRKSRIDDDEFWCIVRGAIRATLAGVQEAIAFKNVPITLAALDDAIQEEKRRTKAYLAKSKKKPTPKPRKAQP